MSDVCATCGATVVVGYLGDNARVELEPAELPGELFQIGPVVGIMHGRLFDPDGPAPLGASLTWMTRRAEVYRRHRC